jgi:hypothetical protein
VRENVFNGPDFFIGELDASPFKLQDAIVEMEKGWW